MSFPASTAPSATETQAVTVKTEAGLVLRFTQWRCGHHSQRPDDIAVSSPAQASQILRAISYAISQPGYANAVLMDETYGVTAYITDDHVNAGHTATDAFPPLDQWHQRRPIMVYGSPEEIAEIQSPGLAEACEVDYGGPIPLWNGTTFVDDSITLSTLPLDEIKAKAAPIDWHDEGQAELFPVPPVYRPAGQLLSELRALAEDLAKPEGGEE